MPLYSNCGLLPFGLGSTEAEDAGVCDVNTIQQNGKCVVDASATTTRDKCIVDVWNIFTANSSSCQESRDEISKGILRPHTDIIMNAVTHCETQPEVWSSISNSLNGCPNESQLMQAFEEHNGPDFNSLRKGSSSERKLGRQKIQRSNSVNQT